MTPASPPLPDLFAGVEGQLAEAAEAVASGAACNLEGIVERVEALCRAALASPPQERTPVMVRLGRVVEMLDGLAQSLPPDEAR